MQWLEKSVLCLTSKNNQKRTVARLQHSRQKYRSRDTEGHAYLYVKSTANNVFQFVSRERGRRLACPISYQSTTQRKVHITEACVILWNSTHFAFTYKGDHCQDEAADEDDMPIH